MENKLYVELPPFTGRNVPIKEIAQAIGKDPHYIHFIPAHSNPHPTRLV